MLVKKAVNRDGAVRALISHKNVAQVRFKPGAISGLSLLLVFILALSIFPQSASVASLDKNQYLQTPIPPG